MHTNCLPATEQTQFCDVRLQRRRRLYRVSADATAITLPCNKVIVCIDFVNVEEAILCSSLRRLH